MVSRYKTRFSAETVDCKGQHQIDEEEVVEDRSERDFADVAHPFVTWKDERKSGPVVENDEGTLMQSNSAMYNAADTIKPGDVI